MKGLILYFEMYNPTVDNPMMNNTCIIMQIMLSFIISFVLCKEVPIFQLIPLKSLHK